MSFCQRLIVLPRRHSKMPQTAFLRASRQEADSGSVRASDVLLTYSWAEVSVSPSNVRSPKEEVP